MTSGDLADDLEPGLLGVEVGRSKIRVALLDGGGRQVIDVAERPIAKAGGPRDPIEEETSTRAALEAALDRIGYTGGPSVVAGAAIGFTNSGVGSGPALRGWLESLSDEIGEPVMLAGEDGISYTPARCIEFVERVFEQAGVPLARVELAPVAATRVLRPLRSAALTLGSGIAWSARLLDSQVLEAFEAADDPFDSVLHIVVGGVAEPLQALHGIDIDDELCRNRGLAVGALAPAVGAAVSILGPEQTNLLRGEIVDGTEPIVQRGPSRSDMASAVPSVSSARTPERRSPGVARTSADPDARSELLTDAGSRGDVAWSATVDDDTRQLRRRRDLVDRAGAADSGFGVESEADLDDDLAGIEAFAHPGEEESRGFNVSDFLLGALGMSAILLLVLLVVA